MRTIRPLLATDQAAFTFLMSNAYPGFKLSEDKRAVIFDYRLSHDDTVLYGSFDGETMVGSYRRHRYEMNLYGRMLPVSGLGGVAVDMPNKKEKVCLEMVKDFHRESLAKGAIFATLYPFDIGFYRHMGYGVCSVIYQYKMRIGDLPKGDKSGCAWITDTKEWLAYYNAYASRTHGMMRRPDDFGALGVLIGAPPKKRVGVWREGRMTGYMELDFQAIGAENPFHYRLDVREILADTPEDLGALLAFLRDQEDQVQELILHSFDPMLHLSLLSCRSTEPGKSILDEFHLGPRAGYGLMIRVLDLARLRTVLQDLRFGQADFEVVFDLHDDLLPQNNGPFPFVVERGRLVSRPASEKAVHIALEMADFSPFIAGAVSLTELHHHQKLQGCADAPLPELDRAFGLHKPLECWTIF